MGMNQYATRCAGCWPQRKMKEKWMNQNHRARGITRSEGGATHIRRLAQRGDVRWGTVTLPKCNFATLGKLSCYIPLDVELHMESNGKKICFEISPYFTAKKTEKQKHALNFILSLKRMAKKTSGGEVMTHNHSHHPGCYPAHCMRMIFWASAPGDVNPSDVPT